MRDTGDSKYHAETALDAILDDLQVRWHALWFYAPLRSPSMYLMCTTSVASISLAPKDGVREMTLMLLGIHMLGGGSARTKKTRDA